MPDAFTASLCKTHCLWELLLMTPRGTLGQVLIAGDFMHGAALQTQHPELCASYDMNREEAIQTRLWISEYGKSKSLIIAGMHLPDDGLLKE